MGEMQSKSDAQLLREYAESGSESAFTELVTRHTDLVYSAALRQVPSSDQACDVAQNVFSSLARGARTLAGSLNPDASLAGWLCRCTRNQALNLRRDDFRRHSRERQAMEHLHPSPETAPDWDRFRPILDEALSGLNEADYDALVLRFFKNQDLRSVGLALGVSDDTAQKRVSRALEKLRGSLAHHGITTTGAALAMAVSAHAVQAAPAGMAVTISSAAMLTGTSLAATTTATVTKAIAMTTLQKALITSTIVAAVGTEIFQMHRASEMREQLQTLWQQQAPLNEQVRDLRRQRDDATNRLALFETEMAGIKSNVAGQLKLRGEVTRFQKDSQELAQLKAKVSRRDDMDAAQIRSFREYQERDAITQLQRIKEAVKLTPDQERALQDLFLKRADLIVLEMQAYNEGTHKEFEGQFSQSMSNVTAQIDAILSPEQQADFKTLQQRVSTSTARFQADGELIMMQKLVGISLEQEDQLYPILMKFASAQSVDDTTFAGEKANALAAVLTPAQMEQYRKFMQGKKVSSAISYPKD
jgi:RNA polymerase sigma factor (sigma-70 family)